MISIPDLLAGLIAAREHLEAGLARANDNHNHIWKQQRPVFEKTGPERQREDERGVANRLASKASTDIVIRYKTALDSMTAEIERLSVTLKEQQPLDTDQRSSDAEFVEDEPPEPLPVRRAWQAYLNLYREDGARTRASGGGTVRPSDETTRAMYAYIDAVDAAEHGSQTPLGSEH